MDKSADLNLEDNDFWEKINSSYFTLSENHIQYLLTFHQKPQEQQIDLPTYNSLESYQLIKSILKSYFVLNTRRKVPTLNNHNVRKYLFVHQNIFDKVENGTLQEQDFAIYSKIADIRSTLKNLSHKSEREQIKILKEEGQQLNSLIGQFNQQEDEIDLLIRSLNEEISHLQKNTQREVTKLIEIIKPLQQNSERIYYDLMTSNCIQFKLARKKELPKAKKQELEQMQWLITHLQNIQLAESISKYDTYNNNFLVSFDPLITSEQIEMKESDLKDFLKFQDLANDFEQEVQNIVTEFCHFCKKNEEKVKMKQCQYQSSLQGLPIYNDNIFGSSQAKIGKQFCQCNNWLQINI